MFVGAREIMEYGRKFLLRIQTQSSAVVQKITGKHRKLKVFIEEMETSAEVRTTILHRTYRVRHLLITRQKQPSITLFQVTIAL